MTVALLVYLLTCSAMTGWFATDVAREFGIRGTTSAAASVWVLSLVAPALLVLEGFSAVWVVGAFVAWSLALFLLALRVQWLRRRAARPARG